MRIFGGITQEVRNKAFITFYAYVGWTENRKRTVKKYPTRLKIARASFDLNTNTIIGVDDDSIKVRNKLQAINDFIARLDLPTQDENIDAFKNYLASDSDFIKEVIPVKFLDFVHEYMKMSHLLLSKSRLLSYRTFVRNIELYIESRKISDVFTAMSRTQQTIFLTGFAEFLLTEHPDKAAYENATVIQEFSKLSAIRRAFPEAGLLVEPRTIVRNLRVTDSEAVYCTEEELKAIIELWPTLRGAEWKAVSLFLFSAMTGLRFNELSEVIEPSINRTRGIYSLTYSSGKKGWINQVPLGSLAMKILEAEKERKFVHNSGDKHLLPLLSSSTANVFLHSALSKIPMLESIHLRVKYRGAEVIKEQILKYNAITMHSGRHTFSHLLTNAKLGLSEVGQLLSHGSVETTNKHYKHMNSEKIQREAIEILDNVTK